MNIPENYVLYINIAVGVIYLLFMIIGFMKGFLYELLSLAYTAISIAVSWFLAPVFASLFPIVNIENLNSDLTLLSKFVDINSLIDTLIYFFICFFLLKIVYLILAFFMKGFNKIPVLGGINKVLGAIFGVVNATFITLALSMLLSLPIFANGNDIKEKSVFKVVNTLSNKAFEYLADNIDFSKYSNDTFSIDVEQSRDEFKKWITSLTD